MVIQELALKNTLTKIGELRMVVHSAELEIDRASDPVLKDKLVLGKKLAEGEINKQLTLFKELSELVGKPWELLSLDDREKVCKVAGG